MLAFADPTTDLDRGPRAKPGSERMCVVTRQVKGTDDLIRFVLSPAGEIVPDLKRKLPGRGLWVSASREAVAEAARRNLFAKGFKCAVKAAPALAADTEILLAKSAMDALAMAAKAGQAVAGFAKVEDAIKSGAAVVLLHASDGAADGIRKLDALLRQRNRDLTNISITNDLSGDELDLALGRSNVVHAALLAGPAAKTFLSRCQTLHRYRHGADLETHGKAGDYHQSEPNA